MINKKVILVVGGVFVLTLIVGGVAFAAGTAYGKTQAENVRAEFFQNRFGPQVGQQGQRQGQNPTGQTDQTDQNSQAARGGGQLGRIAAAGTVKSIDGNKITVTMQNGNTVMVTVDAQTQVIKTVSGAVSDIQTGSRIIVMSDQTGSNITARTISIQPQQTTQ